MAAKMADVAVKMVIAIKNSYREVILEISTPILTMCTKSYQSSISRKSIRHFGIENANGGSQTGSSFNSGPVEISTPFQMLN